MFGQFFEKDHHLCSGQIAKNAPIFFWNRNHHPSISLSDLQGDVIARDFIFDGLSLRDGVRGGFDERQTIIRDQSEAERQCSVTEK